MTAPELKPCPFCGGEASDGGMIVYGKPLSNTTWDDGSPITKAFFCNCIKCGVTNKPGVTGFRTKADAIAAWNTRAPDPDLDAAVGAALAEAADAGYVACAETRHVTLGHKVEAAILALRPTALAELDRAKEEAEQHGYARAMDAERELFDAALDRAKREARVEGVREALGPCDEWTYACDAADAIRALIEKEGKQ